MFTPTRPSALFDRRSALLRAARVRGLSLDQRRHLARLSWDAITLQLELDHYVKRYGLTTPALIERRREGSAA